MTPQDFFNRMQSMDVASFAKQLAGQYAPPAGSLFQRSTGPTQGVPLTPTLPSFGGAGGTAQVPSPSSGGLPGPAVSPPPVVNTPGPAAGGGAMTPAMAQALQQYIQQQLGMQRMSAALGFNGQMPSYITGLPGNNSLSKILGLG